MKIILVDPNLVRTFFGNNFFDPNHFQVRTKLGYLRYPIFVFVQSLFSTKEPES